MIHSLRDDVIHDSFTFFKFLAVIQDSTSTPDTFITRPSDHIKTMKHPPAST